MMLKSWHGFALSLALIDFSGLGAEQIQGRDLVVLNSATARLVVDLGGGAIREFRLRDNELNPLNWEIPAEGDTRARNFAHFLCLDRWGPPSEAEGAKGMPYHGEASNVRWAVLRRTPGDLLGGEAEMTARLPIAGLSVARKIRMSARAAVFAVEETVTNENALGRLYNMVQHPTIAPPFLDEQTVVDCNGRRGFPQTGGVRDPEALDSQWPWAVSKEGGKVDLRRLTDDPRPNVVTYTIEESVGWVTATGASKGLLLGYLWKTSDYPWVSLWRDTKDGRPTARGLEFGTTGLHEPFPILVRKGRIWEQPLFDYLDAGQSVRRSYLAFLASVPPDFRGVGRVSVHDGRIVVRERDHEKPRELTIESGDLGGSVVGDGN